jgi:hypothetical protein
MCESFGQACGVQVNGLQAGGAGPPALHVLGVSAGDLLGGVAEPQDVLDLVGSLEGDGEPRVEAGLFQFILLRASTSVPSSRGLIVSLAGRAGCLDRHRGDPPGP